MPVLYSQLVRFQTTGKYLTSFVWTLQLLKFLFIYDRVTLLELLSRAEQLDPKAAGAQFRWRVLGWIRGKKSLHTALFHNTVTYLILMTGNLRSFEA